MDARTGEVRLRGATRRYGGGRRQVVGMDDVTVEFGSASFTAVMGASGSGKSTLLQCASGLDRCDAGTVTVGGVELGGLSEATRTRLRRDRIGFVFQAFNLLPGLTAAQNVELPLRLANRRAHRDAAREALAVVGLADRCSHRPAELSGGQQQRVAVARALIARPQVLFADEPTGSLDVRSAARLLRLLRDVREREGVTVVLVTHDPAAARHADTVLEMRAGRLVGEQRC